MPERHRDFAIPTDSGREPPTFTLAGEKFTCLPVAPAGALNDLVAGIGEIDGNTVYSAPNLIAFCEAVLVEGDEKRFRKVVHSKKTVVPIETLGDVVMWLAEVLVDRPTEPPRA
jgi:hypothetical protein